MRGAGLRVLLLGADGFIGRHIAFELRAAGVQVLACARRTKALDAMGFQTLRADLTNPATHDQAFWRPYLQGGVHLVNAAGLLTGKTSAFESVHFLAPAAAVKARDGGRYVLISAMGIDTADTAFAYWRRRAEQSAAVQPDVTILRPGLVLADTSYGGSSLIRALAALPLCTVVVGDGSQSFNPMHADDLARAVMLALTKPISVGLWQIGGSQTVTQADMVQMMRGWLGLQPLPLLRLPLWVAETLGRFGDVLKIGPVSHTAVRQLQAGVLAETMPFSDATGFTSQSLNEILARRPAGTQDLWQARIYLLKPAIRLILAFMWLVSGMLGLLLPADSFLPMLQGTTLPDAMLVSLGRIGGVVDLGIAAALIRNLYQRSTAWTQIGMVLAYTFGLTVMAPVEWLAPLGGLLKNLPVLTLMILHLALLEER